MLPEKRAELDTRAISREVTREAIQESVEAERRDLAPDGDADVKDSLAQMGRPLAATEVHRRLLKLNRNLHFERANADPNLYGVYVIENRRNPATGNTETNKRHLCGMGAGMLPEFFQPHYRERRLPDPQNDGQYITVLEADGCTRGWRSVLAILIKERLITESGASRMFDVNAGRSSEKWQAIVN